MPIASTVNAITVGARRHLVRRPWIYWSSVAIAVIGLGAATSARDDRIDAARDAWGDRVAVIITTDPVEPGDPLHGATIERDVPVAVAPESAMAVAALDGRVVARQHLGAGEIVTSADVAPTDEPLALIPSGWSGVAVIESPGSGAAIGDRVRIAADGLIISDEALVVGHVDEATLVAVPDDVAPLVPAAADAGGVSLLLAP